MKCAIMQPTYIPWLGYFDLIRNVDLFIIYDNVQFEKQSWQQRNRLRNQSGELMLTVAVLHEKGLERKINEVKIDHSRNVLKKHLETIKYSYSKAKSFKLLFPELEFIYNQKFETLLQINIELINLGKKHLGINVPFQFASEIEWQGQKVEALIDLCKKVGATDYLSPVGSKVYIDENNLFPENNIQLTYQNFTPPVYQQINNNDFISHLSFIDYLMNSEPEETIKFGQQKFV